MYRLKLILVLSLSFLTVTLSINAQARELKVQRKGDGVYETYGVGDDLKSARRDAIRNALQYAVTQFVVSEIEIEDDKIIKDTLYSTMNGEIDRFVVHDTWAELGQVFISAELEIKDSKIQSTVGRFASAGVGVRVAGNNTAVLESDELLNSISSANAEKVRLIDQAYVSQQLFFQALRGFPARAFDITLSQVSVDQYNPDKINLVIAVEPDSEWVNTHFQYLSKMASVATAGMDRLRQLTGMRSAYRACESKPKKITLFSDIAYEWTCVALPVYFWSGAYYFLLNPFAPVPPPQNKNLFWPGNNLLNLTHGLTGLIADKFIGRALPGNGETEIIMYVFDENRRLISCVHEWEPENHVESRGTEVRVSKVTYEFDGYVIDYRKARYKATVPASKFITKSGNAAKSVAFEVVSLIELRMPSNRRITAAIIADHGDYDSYFGIQVGVSKRRSEINRYCTSRARWVADTVADLPL